MALALPPRAFRETICVFGDSITQEGWSVGGWVSLLADAYRRKADVLNRGFSGYNSRWARGVASHVFPTPCTPLYALTTLFFGANDAVMPHANPRQGVPLEEYTANVEWLIATAAACSRCVVLITPPPVDSTAWPDRACDRTASYAAAVHVAARNARATVGGATRVIVVDLNAMMSGEEGWSRHLRDGLHLSPSGNAMLFNALMAALEGSGVAPADLKLDFPLHRDIDLKPGDDASWAASFTPEALAVTHAAHVVL